MAILVTVADPYGLVAQIKRAIDAGTIVTWAYDSDGDFFHSVPQWRGQAWLRPRVTAGTLILNTIRPTSSRISKEAYAIYHARFVEMLLAHFDNQFSNALTTALPVEPDNV